MKQALYAQNVAHIVLIAILAWVFFVAYFDPPLLEFVCVKASYCKKEGQYSRVWESREDVVYFYFFVVHTVTFLVCANALIRYLLDRDKVADFMKTNNDRPVEALLDSVLWGQFWPPFSFHFLKIKNKFGLQRIRRWELREGITYRLLYSIFIAPLYIYIMSNLDKGIIRHSLGWQGFTLVAAIAAWVLLTEAIALLVIYIREE